MTIYRESEKGRYEPPACPDCGVRVDQGWADVTSRSDPERMFTPGRWTCHTPGCPKNAEARYGRA